MRSGTRILHANTAMPILPVRQRHDSPKRGDNKAAIRRARGGNFDGNLQILAGDIWLAHWPTPARNGYTRVYDPKRGRVRRMNPLERRRHGNRWGAAGIKRWRRPNNERPLTYDEAIVYAVTHGAVCVGELKSPLFGTGDWAQRAVAVCKRHDHPAWMKTLPTMRGAQAKVAKTRAAGGQVALIYGSGVRGRLRRLAMTRRITLRWTVKPNRTW